MVATIRTLTGDDAPQFRTLRLRGLQESPLGFLSSYETEAARPPAEAHALFRSRISERSVVIGAADDAGAFGPAGGLIGVVGVRADEAAKRAHRGHVWGMYVAPEARGMGIGRLLMTAAIDAARGMPGLERLDLTVWSGNDSAVALYLSLGFETWGREKDALKIDGAYYDDDWMSLEL